MCQHDLDQIQDVAQAKRAIVGLLNLVEDLQDTVRELQGEVQRLRDEINRLKGEQGEPDIKPNRRGKQPGPGTDHSSEAERRKPQAWQKGSKLAKGKIDREEVLTVDRVQLPADAEFKGYEDSIVQDVVIHTDNVLYHKEKYYSPRGGGRIWRSCRRAIVGNSGRVSKRWLWCSILPATWRSRRSWSSSPTSASNCRRVSCPTG